MYLTQEERLILEDIHQNLISVQQDLRFMSAVCRRAINYKPPQVSKVPIVGVSPDLVEPTQSEIEEKNTEEHLISEKNQNSSVDKSLTVVVSDLQNIRGKSSIQDNIQVGGFPLMETRHQSLRCFNGTGIINFDPCISAFLNTTPKFNMCFDPGIVYESRVMLDYHKALRFFPSEVNLTNWRDYLNIADKQVIQNACAPTAAPMVTNVYVDITRMQVLITWLFDPGILPKVLANSECWAVGVIALKRHIGFVTIQGILLEKFTIKCSTISSVRSEADIVLHQELYFSKSKECTKQGTSAIRYIDIVLQKEYVTMATMMKDKLTVLESVSSRGLLLDRFTTAVPREEPRSVTTRTHYAVISLPTFSLVWAVDLKALMTITWIAFEIIYGFVYHDTGWRFVYLAQEFVQGFLLFIKCLQSKSLCSSSSTSQVVKSNEGYKMTSNTLKDEVQEGTITVSSFPCLISTVKYIQPEDLSLYFRKFVKSGGSSKCVTICLYHMGLCPYKASTMSQTIWQIAWDTRLGLSVYGSYQGNQSLFLTKKYSDSLHIQCLFQLIGGIEVIWNVNTYHKIFSILCGAASLSVYAEEMKWLVQVLHSHSMGIKKARMVVDIHGALTYVFRVLVWIIEHHDITMSAVYKQRGYENPFTLDLASRMCLMDNGPSATPIQQGEDHMLITCVHSEGAAVPIYHLPVEIQDFVHFLTRENLVVSASLGVLTIFISRITRLYVSESAPNTLVSADIFSLHVISMNNCQCLSMYVLPGKFYSDKKKGIGVHSMIYMGNPFVADLCLHTVLVHIYSAANGLEHPNLVRFKLRNVFSVYGAEIFLSTDVSYFPASCLLSEVCKHSDRQATLGITGPEGLPIQASKFHGFFTSYDKIGSLSCSIASRSSGLWTASALSLVTLRIFSTTIVRVFWTTLFEFLFRSAHTILHTTYIMYTQGTFFWWRDAPNLSIQRALLWSRMFTYTMPLSIPSVPVLQALIRHTLEQCVQYQPYISGYNSELYQFIVESQLNHPLIRLLCNGCVSSAELVSGALLGPLLGPVQ